MKQITLKTIKSMLGKTISKTMNYSGNTKQHDASDCAAAVISTVLLTYKHEATIMKIREIIGTDAYGTSVKGIVEGLEKLKFDVKAIRAKTKDITMDVTLPAIAQVRTTERQNHFIVIHKIDNKRQFVIADPSGEVIIQTEEEFDSWFTGVLIVMLPTSEFEKTNIKGKGMFDIFTNLILPQQKLLITIIFSSLFLSLVGILSSLFSKVLMDEIIPYQLKTSVYIFLIILEFQV